MVGRSKTLLDLISEAEGQANPNPFVLACMEQADRMKTIIESVPSLRRSGQHADCIATFAMLQAEPTYDRLKAVREAIDAYEDSEFQS